MSRIPMDRFFNDLAHRYTVGRIIEDIFPTFGFAVLLCLIKLLHVCATAFTCRLTMKGLTCTWVAFGFHFRMSHFYPFQLPTLCNI